MLYLKALPGDRVHLGRRGENLARTIQFDISEWVDLYGEGRADVIVCGGSTATPYPCSTYRDGNIVNWPITSAYTSVCSNVGRYELIYTVGDAVVKSAIGTTRVDAALDDPSEVPPEAYRSWTEEVLAVAADVTEAVKHNPRIFNSNWYVWDASLGKYIDTGVSAVGSAGPTGPDGAAGKDGITPHIKDGTWWLGDEDTGVNAVAGAEAAEAAAEAASREAKNAALAREAAETVRETVEESIADIRNTARNVALHAADAENAKGRAEDAAETAASFAAASKASYNSAKESASSAISSAKAAQKFAESIDINAIIADINSKGDNLVFDNEEGLLYLTSNGKRIGNGIKVSTSGGGGGGGESNNAVLTLKNTTGWIYKNISVGADCPISFTWSSLEDGVQTGQGVIKIFVNDTVKYQASIEQGDRIVDIGEYLSAGSNSIKITVTDIYGNTRPIVLNVTCVALSLTSPFNAYTPYSGAIDFPYVPTGNVAKTMHFLLDGEEIGTANVTTSGRQQSYTIPAQAHGTHSFEAYFEADVDGETVESNHLHYMIPCIEEGNTRPLITTPFRATSAEQYDTITIPYWVYNPSGLTSDIVLYDGVKSVPLTVDRTLQTWSYRIENYGELNLSIVCGESVLTFVLDVSESHIDVNAETDKLSLHLSSYGRSNNEANPSEWRYGDTAATLTGFNFTSDGWMEDEQGITVLRVGGNARVDIPLQMFANDFRTTGKTIEIEFASRSVLDYDAVLATCWSGDRGLKITAQNAQLKSEQEEVITRYKEDEHLRLSFVIEKLNENRLIIGYVNGIISGMIQYPDDDDFSQSAPVNISIGSNDCTIDIYNIRVYDNSLTRFQMLDNWIADTQDMGQRKDRYVRNNIFNDYGQILPDTLSPHQCYMIIKCPVLPTFKGDVKICSGIYVDPVHPERSFTFTDAEIDVQGTSSQFYYIKNFKIKFIGGFMRDGIKETTYAMSVDVVPTDEYTFKADVASSEGANNVVLAELYNDLCPVKTPAQERDARVRQTIAGHPIVMFHDDGSGAKFIGKYNFNNDKGTSEVFGFTSGDESWEILENGNALVSFKSADFTNWESSFEGRYPKKNKDTTRLQEFVAWVASTNTEGQSEEEKAIRLARFKDELSYWADVEDAIFYYLFTLIFLCIDQREKNAFPTWNAEMRKWLWLFYDADSSLGTDNKGKLTFEYWMEDIDYTEAGEPVFNGQNNVFWSNLRVCFADEIRDEYRRLRTTLAEDGKALLSYDRVNELFSAHQGQWSEAIYNEDAWRKAVEPLEKIGDDQYLPMQQGKKEQHFKHWMFNRFRYLDSKFETGAALDDENRIMMRAHAQGNIWLTSYINMYGQVYFNAARAEHRMMRDQAYEFVWTAEGAEDAVIGINSAPMITSLGDLSPLKLEYCHIQYAPHLTMLKVGDAAEGYENGNFVALTLGNNKLLRKLDVRNCPNLTQSVNASGCTNIEEVYFDNTAITGLSLSNGGILKILHLPETITNLTIRNQKDITEFVMPGYSNITTLRLENVSDAVPMRDIFNVVPASSRVRLIGFDWSFDSAADIIALCNRLDTMRGLDENGINTDKAQVSGTVRVANITGSQLASIRERYPDIKVVYENLTSYLYFYDETGEEVLQILEVNGGGDGAYTGATPTKESTAQYAYTFAGWSKTIGGSVDDDALLNIETDRSVYAVFTATLRTYTVKWMNGSTLLETDTNVPYGTVPVYNGADPVYNGSGDPTEYAWIGWSPAVGAITGDTTYTAEWKFTGFVYVKLIDRSIKNIESNVESVGNSAFIGCSSLKTVDFPVATSISAVVFEYVSSLTTVNIPAVTSIGVKAFYACTALTAVDLPSVTSIGSEAFAYCKALTAFILRSETVATLSDTDALESTPIASRKGYIYVPRALVNSYKAATNWSTYANQFRALEDYTVDGTTTGELDPAKIAA